MARTSITVGTLKEIECRVNCDKPQTCMVEFDIPCKDCTEDVVGKMGLDVGSLMANYCVQDATLFLTSTLYNAMSQWAN